VPTVAESGLAGFESTSWQGWFVPANTPHEIVGVIQRAAAKALASPDLLEQLRVTGNEPLGSTPEEFAGVFKTDLAKFAKVVKEANIPVQD
jgi:tripartite-type tricarboxylate transporter receptor subunit TctC